MINQPTRKSYYKNFDRQAYNNNLNEYKSSRKNVGRFKTIAILVKIFGIRGIWYTANSNTRTFGKNKCEPNVMYTKVKVASLYYDKAHSR